MKELIKFDSLVQELENQLLTNEEQIMLLAGQGSGQGLYDLKPVNNCTCGGNNCNCASSGNNCKCNGLNNGKIEWEKSQEYRLSVKLKNAACQKCSIAPICGGGCSRYILDKEGKPYCLFNYDSKAIERFILNYVEKMIMRGCVNN